MKIDIRVKDFLGDSYGCEDAILLREIIKNNLTSGVILDFEGITKISSAFLTSLFSDLIIKLGRDYVFNQIDVKNLSNYNDYSRVVLGTTFQ